MNRWVSLAVTALTSFIISAVGALANAGATSTMPTKAQIFWACAPALGAAALCIQKAMEEPPK